MSDRSKRLWLAGVTGLLMGGLLALIVLRDHRAADGAPTYGNAGAFRAGRLPQGVGGARAPQFALRDASGVRLSTTSLKGRPYLVTFLYTNCRDVCPLIGEEIKQALHQLGRRGHEVTALAISADPRATRRRLSAPGSGATACPATFAT